MAIVKQCDRCGKFYNPYPMSNNPNMYNALRRVQMTDSNMNIFYTYTYLLIFGKRKGENDDC